MNFLYGKTTLPKVSDTSLLGAPTSNHERFAFQLPFPLSIDSLSDSLPDGRGLDSHTLVLHDRNPDTRHIFSLSPSCRKGCKIQTSHHHRGRRHDPYTDRFPLQTPSRSVPPLHRYASYQHGRSHAQTIEEIWPPERRTMLYSQYRNDTKIPMHVLRHPL